MPFLIRCRSPRYLCVRHVHEYLNHTFSLSLFLFALFSKRIQSGMKTLKDCCFQFYFYFFFSIKYKILSIASFVFVVVLRKSFDLFWRLIFIFRERELQNENKKTVKDTLILTQSTNPPPPPLHSSYYFSMCQHTQLVYVFPQSVR